MLANDECLVSAAVPCRVQLRVDAMHTVGKVLFRQRLCPDLETESFGASPSLAKFLRHKIAKCVEFDGRHLQGNSWRSKADFSPQPGHILFDAPVGRPKVRERRRIWEPIPTVGITVGKVPHALFRRTPTVPRPVEMVIGMFQPEE